MIAALDKNGVIGVDGGLPWRLPDEMRFFRQTTLGKPIVMGRKTYESIGKPLKKRTNIILTRNPDYVAEGCLVVDSAEKALSITPDAEEIVIAGGGVIYDLFLPQATRLYLSYVETEVDGDIYFPTIDDANWRETWRNEHPADERHAYSFCSVILERVVS